MSILPGWDRRMSCHSPSISSRPGISAPICSSPARAVVVANIDPRLHARSRRWDWNCPSMMRTGEPVIVGSRVLR